MPRYVVLTHDHPVWHWDFMLETSGVLKTWRLDAAPLSASPIRAFPLAPHRLEYLEYEGPVSGDRGVVARWDSGGYEVLEEASCRLVLNMSGNLLQGVAELWESGEGVLFKFVPKL